MKSGEITSTVINSKKQCHLAKSLRKEKKDTQSATYERGLKIN